MAGGLGLNLSSTQGSAKMFNLQQELWDMEGEEEEEEEVEGEEGSSPEDPSTESEETCSERCQQPGRGCQDPPIHRPPQWRPRELRSCRRRLFAPYDWQDGVHSLPCTGCRRGSGAVAHPWGRGRPPWDPHVGSWVQDTGAICQSHWCLEQAAASSSRTLSHPSFQTFFAALSTRGGSCPPSPGGQRTVPQGSGGPLPLVDHNSFFCTDPRMPPGYRIYNSLPTSSQEVLRSLQLNTPAPVMCTRPAPPGHRWLSDLECRAVSALLALPISTGGDASPCPAPGATGCGGTGALAPCQ